jgi:hypothetical protein
MIWNKIMIHFGHPKPIANNQKLYSNNKWIKGQTQAWKDVLNFGFRVEWWFLFEKADNVAEVILLDIHYKYDKVENMAGLLDVIDKESCASFLMDNATRTIVVIYTTHSMKDVPIVWKGLDWESFLLVHLNVRAMFKIIASICDHVLREPIDYHVQINFCYKNSIWVWAIHGKTSKGSKFFDDVIERSYVNVC